jgi:malonyl-CoA O-methyltransferase
MQELKHLGAHHVIAGRNKNITTKTAMHQMIAAYEKHRVGDQIPATFEVIIVIAKV